MQYSALLLLASTAFAHFRVPFPGERNATNWDTQTTGPCGGANRPVLPRYEWNPQGSPVEIAYHHTYGVGTLFYCGSGDCDESADFDTLLYAPVDQTKGNFCIPALQLPEEFNKINSTGVVQIVYADPNPKGGYTYMYNCIDVIVSEDGPLFDGQCSNSTDVEIKIDEGIAELEASSIVPLDEIETLTYLESARAIEASKTAASASATMGGMDMGGMSGMDMGGHDHGHTSASAEHEHGSMTGMEHEHGSMTGMDHEHGSMTGMEHGHGSMTGMEHGHGSMTGMEHGHGSMTTVVSSGHAHGQSSSAPAPATSAEPSKSSSAGAVKLAVSANAIAALIAMLM
ncbi:hypothetical protein CANINC_000685 [Pichia inconspicua]|uniref:Copper acquisition factor BIM1-like domain-containing protein n=1 Tax=Pichia inconspicua TaxID=52247 RepID=A0A4T0X5P7_9ASCO|nr:hypothetical protein CANINC_000685 [[Candida] inconspicua]